MDELVGTLLDHFKVVELLGRGGMGAVYKARDVRLQRDVALKVMHPHIAEQGDFKARFLQEARSAAQLDHPGIVKVHYFGQVDDLLYIVMQFIPGANLRDMLEALKEDGHWVPLDEAVQLVRQVSLALDYAHRRGVLHRDIKPKNIMIDPEPGNGLPYRPVITDLGLAKLADSDVVTRPGSSMGTPAYMSPEQALGKETDARSDVYSLGVLLYELTVGRVPFPAKTITEAIRYHTREDPPAPRAIRPDLPHSLEDLILRALAKAPGDRFPQAAALARALHGVSDAATQVATAPPSLTNAVSLMTQYQQSLTRPRGASVLAAFDTPTGVEGDVIQVLVDDKTVATVPLKPGVTTIGRMDDNDVVLDDPRASRHHAQVAFDGSGYRVVDQGSSNGTYLANAKLLPGVYEPWTSDKPLRIGATWLHLVRADRPLTEPLLASRAIPAASIGDLSSSGAEGWVGLLLEPQQLAVQPGETASATVTVFNQGPLVDHFQVSVQGIPAAWVVDPPGLIRLLPGHQGTTALAIRPPRAPQTRAGTHPLTIRVAGQNDAEQVAEVSATLMVGPYYDYDLDLRPRRRSSLSDGRFALEAENRGNAGLTLRLDAIDMEDGCRFSFDPAPLIVPAGTTRAAQLTVQARTPLRGDRARTYLFTVTARPDEVPEGPRQIQGTWVQTPPAYELRLQPTSQSGTSRGTYAVHLTNTGQSDLTLALAAGDAAGACRFSLSPSQIALPAGQERTASLTVSAQSSGAPSAPVAHAFTVTARPSDVSGFERHVEGQWTQTPPPQPTPAVAQQTASAPVVPSAPVAPAAVTQPKRRWFWGCTVLGLGLLFTLFAAYVALIVAHDNLRFEGLAAWLPAMAVGGVLLLLTTIGAIRVWRGGGEGEEAAPRSSEAPPKVRWFSGLVVFGIGGLVTLALGWGAGYTTFEILSLGDPAAWFAAGTVWLVGLIVSFRIARKVARPA